jgi:two-component system NtrC family response regulator/two-component system response regulator HydG
VLCKGIELTAEDLPPSLRGPRAQPDPGSLIPGATLYAIEREAILRTLEMVHGSTAQAAKVLGISVRKIQYRLKEYSGDAPPTAHGHAENGDHHDENGDHHEHGDGNGNGHHGHGHEGEGS